MAEQAANPSKARKIALRTVTGGVLTAIFLTLMWHPALEAGFGLFVVVLCGVGLYEYYAIVRAREISPETIGGILAGTAVTLSGYFDSVILTNFLLFGGCLLVSALHIVRGQHSVAGLASTVFGVFYVGWFGAHVLLLHHIAPAGAGMVTVLFTAVVLTDTAAYFVGSAIGRHKLAPKASPNKTWEGSIGGFVFTLAGMAVLCRLHAGSMIPGLPEWGLGGYLYAGAVLSIASQVGDLAESCLKRDAGVKDSGMLFPGHGGVLDRCDGFLFAAPVLYYMAVPWFTI
ncbi:MAG: phosphatidate cytidylyltransferase [Candidatus Hydrogenedentes bacterium]|nr:phosphatidate cytidylyltransferase [Candidatus Hydrogenedentota bacterium]